MPLIKKTFHTNNLQIIYVGLIGNWLDKSLIFQLLKTSIYKMISLGCERHLHDHFLDNYSNHIYIETLKKSIDTKF